MTPEGITWLVVATGFVQFVGVIVLIVGQREILRTLRAVAGLVYQEEQKTRILLNDLLSRGH